ncbi:TonB-dependent receptor [Alishewanella sp. HH-ZS]|uniref:TonB-dependent receptor family protein n=1 Tax=Alishewanella sp. HH-ZS TaxID=1856684 RepID=UPI00082359B6|nr:TonB-dependent receptor [Alishewanella sp. HH-ZS]OCW93261.1 TonB-dependent receptor [Alishewanella sp. HH-ZS]
MKVNRVAQHVALALAICSLQSQAAEPQEKQSQIEVLEVRGAQIADSGNKLPDIQQGRIFAGKKTSVVELSEQPTLIEPNLRQMFATLPGLFVSEQKIPSIYNVNYRGLGDPHESEFVAFYQDNVPLAANLFGYATMYYMPGGQRIERVEFIRGGSGLLYGPQIGPVVNFVTRGPSAQAETRIVTEHAVGSDAMYSTYNEARWSQGNTGFMASFDHRRADGPRNNEDFDVSSGYLGLSYEGFKDIKIGANLDVYSSDSGEAGRLTSAEFANNRDLVKTPFNRVKIDQTLASLTYEQQLDAASSLNGKIWYLAMDRFSRRSGAFVPPANPPSSTTVDEQQFRNLGYDLRYSLAWGENNILTAGTSGFSGDSPRTQHRNSDLTSDAQNAADLRFEQDRVTTYTALFVENLFRFGNISLVPAVRYERLNYDMVEVVKSASLNRDAIDLDRTFNELLFGLGAGLKLSDTAEVYANISESYRPQRFDDLINPTSELAGSNDPSVSKAMNYELGYRSQVTEQFAFDVSVFRIDFKDKIEQIQVNITDIERVNSGDSRHQGVELSLQYAFALSPGHNLTAFANGSWLDTEITSSTNASLVGNKVSFAPDYLVRTGLNYASNGLTAALSLTLVGDQYWQDSNLPRGTGTATIDAKIPSYQVVDLTGEYELSAQWSLYAGINNLLDENYYSRVRTDGIEPAPERTAYFGFRFSL